MVPRRVRKAGAPRTREAVHRRHFGRTWTANGGPSSMTSQLLIVYSPRTTRRASAQSRTIPPRVPLYSLRSGRSPRERQARACERPGGRLSLSARSSSLVVFSALRYSARHSQVDEANRWRRGQGRQCGARLVAVSGDDAEIRGGCIGGARGCPCTLQGVRRSGVIRGGADISTAASSFAESEAPAGEGGRPAEAVADSEGA